MLLRTLVAAGVIAGAFGCRRESTAPSAPAVPPAPAAAPKADLQAADAQAAAVPAPPPSLPPGQTVTLLYSSNLRGEYEAHPLGGLARRATYASEVAARARGEGGVVVQLDAGDSLLPRLDPVPGDPPPDRKEVERRARLVATGLGRLKLDAFAPGEADLALGPARLKALARQARLPIVSANVLDARGKPLFDTHRFLQLGERRVGIFGVLTLSEADAAAAKALGYSVGDPLEAAQGLTSALREKGAEVVVGLFHLAGGVDEARKLGGRIAGLDVMVLGHAASAPAEPLVVGGGSDGAALAVEALERGKLLGRLDLHLVDGDLGFLAPTLAAAGAGGRSWYQNTIVRLDTGVLSDPAMQALIRPYVEENRRRAERKLPVGLTAQAGSDGKLAEGAAEKWTYASSAACGLCHGNQKLHQETSVHAFAMATLQRKGRERDPYCLGCHATGFGVPGGTRNLQTAVTYFANVGCESCHGPSVVHVQKQTKATTRLQAPESVCRECHKPEHSPEPFVYTEALKEVLGPGHGG
jgi:2',3'-cyclic-nucleotide 2'-phosphodiesterase (5'-nucleotidase family)